MNNEVSLERIIPDQLAGPDAFDQYTLRLHQERYAFAVQYGQPGLMLDIACGSGYGSYQMIRSDRFRGSRIKAVDIEAAAIEYARGRYVDPAIEFVCADAMQYNPGFLFDTIVSLETIEHLRDPDSFAKKLYYLLNENGILIISAPVTPSTDGNPHHLTDFTLSGFRKLFDDLGFSVVAQLKQTQPFTLSSIFQKKNKRLSQMRHSILKYYLKNPGIFVARILSVFRDGLNNKYLTLALQKNNPEIPNMSE